jgi:integrase
MQLESLGGNFKGVSINKLKTGAVAYYITYKDEYNKPKRKKVGESPDMTKSKAKKLLLEKQIEIANNKALLKGNNPKAISKKQNNEIYTLNDLADFYYTTYGSKLKNLKDHISKYNYHFRNSLIAQKPLQLITEEDLEHFLEVKHNQRADKRRNVDNLKPIEEKEAEEYQSNQEAIERLQTMLPDIDENNRWIYENKISALQKKNATLYIRLNPTAAEKIWKDELINEDDKRLMLGVLSRKTVKDTLLKAITIVNYGINKKKLNIKNPFVIPASDQLHIKIDNIRDRYMTKEEIKLYLSEAKRIATEKAKHKQIYLMALLALTTGAREKSIMTIKVEDIDLEHGNIRLHNHKTGKIYTGHIASEEIKEEILALIEGRDKSDFLFQGAREGKQPAGFPRVMGEILDYTVNYKKNYIYWLALKDFRNTVASHLAMNGVPMATIAQVLNHSDIVVTQRYAHLAPDTSKSGVENFMASLSN